MRRRKKADRAGLHAWHRAWAVGLVRGRGRAVSGRAAGRRVVAAARTPGKATARVHPRWHNQDPDPVSSGYGPGAAATGRSRHQCGAAPVAARALERDPGRAPPSGLTAGPRRDASSVDNLAGHKTPDLVVWLCQHGVMPLYTPVGGSWLNMAESIERVLKRRALDGQHPHS